MTIQELVNFVKNLPEQAEVYITDYSGSYPITGVIADETDNLYFIHYLEGNEL